MMGPGGPLAGPLRLGVAQARWCNEVLKSVCAFRPSQFMPGILYLENHLISSLNDYCKRKETPEKCYLESSRLAGPHFRPNRGTPQLIILELQLVIVVT